LLARAERAATTFAAGRDRDFQLGRIDRAWEDLLFTEFHDILSGTSIPSAWEGVRAMQGRARIIGEEVVYETVRQWARRTLPSADFQQIAIVNPDREDWAGYIAHEPWLEFDVWGDRWLSTPEGEPIDFQLIQPEAQQGINRVVFPATVPAGDAVQVLVRDDPAPERSVASDLRASESRIENSAIQIDLAPGGIAAITHGGRPLLGSNGIGLHLRHDHSDTWGFKSDRFDEPVDAEFASDGWVVEEAGPLRARVRTEGWLGRSWVRWSLSLHRTAPRIEMLLEVLFAERYKALQMPVQLAGEPTRWTDGLAGGSVERQPNPAEWPVLGWSRMESSDDSLAIATHDAYSLSVDGDIWQWTLLRSPRMSWGGKDPTVYAGRDWHTDQGMHAFGFLLLPGASLDPDGLATAARQLAQPPIVFDRYEGMQRPPWGAQPPRRLFTGAEQRAEQDGKLALPVDERNSAPFL